MRLASFRIRDRKSCGVRFGDRLIETRALADHAAAEIQAVIAAGPELWRRVADEVEAAPSDARLDEAEVELLPVVPAPGKFVCLGLNFRDHAAEGDFAIPDYPAIFLRASSSLVAHGAALVRPAVSETFDYEAELAVVIGRRARHVPKGEALAAVFGYTIFNDASVRAYQRKTHQWTVGKNFDGTGALGPDIVTVDALPPGAHGLRIRTRLNGETVQDSNTADMIFSVADAVSILSEAMTLEPGDVIAMGTPAGVGHARTPPLWMKPGDLCEVEIEGVGVLRNPVIDEAGAGAPARAAE